MRSFGNEDVESSNSESISDEEGINRPSSFTFRFWAPIADKDHFSDLNSENQHRKLTWSAVFKETEELICLNENAGSFSSHAVNSEANKTKKVALGPGSINTDVLHGLLLGLRYCKLYNWYPLVVETDSLTNANWYNGIRGVFLHIQELLIQYYVHYDVCSGCRGKAKFSIRVPSDTAEASSNFMMKEKLKGLEEIEPKLPKHSMSDILQHLHQEKEEQYEVHLTPSKISSLRLKNTGNSIANLLEDLQEKNDLHKITSKLNDLTKNRRSKQSGKRNMFRLDNRTLNNEDQSKPMDSSQSSKDVTSKLLLEANDHSKLKLATSGMKGQTMADRFQQALNAANVNDGGIIFAASKQIGIGIYGRLQQVIQTEKERHMNFLKQSHADESKCIDVKILSRYLDAKHIVCQCVLVDNTKNLQCAGSPIKITDSDGRRIFIFSSRICVDVELQVGNFVRIHPPWNEVQVMGKVKRIVLCTYFSQSPVSF
ncbi:hypothetical protein GIB67_006897 [Kingdonia uniflora]|uniref:Uncharacterized protein n=1 Tax=Kingdonia uniflora TaxID=39325 RepID=A0A7J7L056_9MAGN|nr:hypothetical protein GIB67_006897 [Kingdonia uniflora]